MLIQFNGNRGLRSITLDITGENMKKTKNGLNTRKTSAIKTELWHKSLTEEHKEYLKKAGDIRKHNKRA